MTSAHDSEVRSAGQWPIAITLVLCSLFAAVVALMVKREYENYRFDATEKAALEARIIAEHVDGTMLSARASLDALSNLSSETIASLSNVSPNIEAIVVFDTSGLIAAQGATPDADLPPLTAAAQLATAEGWTTRSGSRHPSPPVPGSWPNPACSTPSCRSGPRCRRARSRRHSRRPDH